MTRDELIQRATAETVEQIMDSIHNHRDYWLLYHYLRHGFVGYENFTTEELRNEFEV